MIRPHKNGTIRPHDPEHRGYNVVYRREEKNYCPGCARTQWWLGRMSAECVWCGTALPYVDAQMSGTPMIVRKGADGSFVEREWARGEPTVGGPFTLRRNAAQAT